MQSSINVKIGHKNMKIRRNNVSSLKEIHELIQETFNPKLLPQSYTLTYIDNENDTIQLITEKCFVAAICIAAFTPKSRT